MIAKISSQITQDIDDFWKGVNVNKSKLVLDGENLILIYEYILAKSWIKDLQAHIQMCFEFSTPFLKQTRVGYCLTTIQMAMTMLTEQTDLINIRDSEGSSDNSPDDDAHWQQRRMSMAQSIHIALESNQQDEFALEMPENILQNTVQDVQIRKR